MNINTNSLVSITEANQNFSKVARLVDENGVAIILKNNVPRYVITGFSQYQAEEMTDNEDVKSIASRLIARHRVAFEKLAK
jgi:antitoxin Phd